MRVIDIKLITEAVGVYEIISRKNRQWKGKMAMIKPGGTRFNTVAPKVYSLDQQYQNHLGICCKNRLAESRMLGARLRNMSSDGFDAHSCLRTTDSGRFG